MVLGAMGLDAALRSKRAPSGFDAMHISTTKVTYPAMMRSIANSRATIPVPAA